VTAVDPDVRERAHQWTDPLLTAAHAAETDGLTFLSKLISGELPPPPIATTMGFGLVEVSEGRAVFAMEIGEHHFNPIGSVHGGVFATLLDSAAGCSVHSALPAGVRYTSLDLSVKFLRGLHLDSGPVRCEGQLLHMGGRTALAEAKLYDSAGRLCAHATSSCLLIRSGRA
jgi:uncharacterized protein (TIGR00369 family)